MASRSERIPSFPLLELFDYKNQSQNKSGLVTIEMDIEMQHSENHVWILLFPARILNRFPVTCNMQSINQRKS